jgi:hypothetical protein
MRKEKCREWLGFDLSASSVIAGGHEMVISHQKNKNRKRKNHRGGQRKQSADKQRQRGRAYEGGILEFRQPQCLGPSLTHTFLFILVGF